MAEFNIFLSANPPETVAWQKRLILPAWDLLVEPLYMDADEREIFYFLKGWKGQFISSREICRRAGGKKRFQASPEWAKPILTRMVERGILETDPAGHFRIRPPPRDGKLKRWVSPQIAGILQRSGSTTAETFIIEDNLDDYYEKL